MKSAEQLAKAIRMSLADEYYRKLHEQFMEFDKEWLVEELIKQISRNDDGVTLGKQLIAQLNDVSVADEENSRMRRIKKLQLDELHLSELIDRFNAVVFERGEKDPYHIDPPEKGQDLVGEEHRTHTGSALLLEAKDLLYALLYCSKKEYVNLHRVEHELLTIVLPHTKAFTFSFLRMVTEISSFGSWRDPSNEASDDHAQNVILEVQYGEVASERVGDGIIACLRVINELEVNEKILYARMRNVEQSSLEIEE